MTDTMLQNQIAMQAVSTDGKRSSTWVLDPNATYRNEYSPEQIVQACGYIPMFLAEQDERMARAQMRENYGFGELYEFKHAHVTDDGVYQDQTPLDDDEEPDPDLQPYAWCELHGRESVYIYPYGIVAIVNADTGSQFVTRMD